MLIDSREEARYKGLYEPIDTKSGHIPNALNYEWMGNLADGHYLEVSQLVSRLQEIDIIKTPITVYCSYWYYCLRELRRTQAGLAIKK